MSMIKVSRIYKMNKKFFLLFFILLIFLLSCTSKVYYIKPEVVGKVYDFETKTPILNTTGTISFYLGEENKINIDNEGNFKVNAVSKNYYLIEPNMQEISLSAPQLYINFKGYESKIVDYLITSKSLNTNPNPGAKEIEKIDIGIIYLNRLK